MLGRLSGLVRHLAHRQVLAVPAVLYTTLA
jgi:hypothetical protein